MLRGCWKAGLKRAGVGKRGRGFGESDEGLVGVVCGLGLGWCDWAWKGWDNIRVGDAISFFGIG